MQWTDGTPGGVAAMKKILYNFNPFLEHRRSQDTGSDSKKIVSIKEPQHEFSTLPRQSTY